MLEIAIVEDEENYRKVLWQYLRKYETETAEQIHISVFTDGDEIVEHYSARYDIILMDIEMRFMNGMDAARKIREVDRSVIIIFITNMAQYAIQGYEVDNNIRGRDCKIMNEIALIQDIPKIYTALAEWVSCVIYIMILRKDHRFSKKELSVLGGTLLLLIGLQKMIGVIPIGLWIPGMVIAVLIMFWMILYCSGANKITAGYWLVRAFVLAEMTASLEWQISYFLSENFKIHFVGFEPIFMVIAYMVTFLLVYLVESRHERILLDVTIKEFLTTAVIGIVCFCLSNLSYVYSNTPFSSPFAREAFNIRTLIDVGGYAFLLAYHLQRCEDHVKTELDAIQNILRTQYSQYRQSQESIDIINHKYHDLKHQIAVLRQEKNLDKKEAYLDEMEQSIKDYEFMFKTGNGVFDTLLTGVALKCSRRNITFTCVADGTLLNQIYVMDLCTIFGNALDNAMEYVVQIEDPEKRLIHVTVSKMEEFVLIRIENYLQDDVKFDGELPATTKSDKAYHGFGLKSIKYSVEKYHGTMEVKTEEHWFTINILIPIQLPI